MDDRRKTTSAIASEAHFKKNIAILGSILPKLPPVLQELRCRDISLSRTRKGQPNLQSSSQGQTLFIHSNYDAVLEAEKQFKEIDLQGVTVLYVYGVGLGYLYEAAKPWLEESAGHYIVFLEDNLEVLYHLLHTQRGNDILLDRQVQLHYFKDIADGDLMFQWLSWYFIQTRCEVLALPYYSKLKGDSFFELKRKLLHDAVVRNQQVSEYMRFGSAFFHNFYSNVLSLPESYDGNKFFASFKNVPAIICGAGPSLDLNFDLLKQLGNRALVFAGGSSLNALSTRGFLPHFGAGIDPNPPQLERLLNNHAYEVPFFYRSRMYHPAFQAIHGPKLYITGTGGYHVADWFDEKLKISGDYLDEGYNVVNFSASIAEKMGCNPIIFVGMDLAYSSLRSYASGVVSNPEISEKKIMHTNDLESGAFIRNDINGKPVHTLWKWVAESKWISNLAQINPSTTFINATEGGLGFDGIRNMTLKDVAARYLTSEYDLKGEVHTRIQNAAMPYITSQKVSDLVLELDASLEHCIDRFKIIVDEIEKASIKLKETGKGSSNLQSEAAVKAEKELMGEPAFHSVLAIFNDIYSKSINRETHQIKHDKSLKTERDRSIKLLEINARKFSFLAAVADNNRSIINLVRE